ncbi:flagellar hook capping FlgD N-terminal domain-containing protein [Pusillimonas noertemannii]|uniref:flagellar hook capping FlgD N-terminal domain-containing protein n=1 Tax=Pusillimonas noertemannii TaxID=305977 RepID=UPI0002EB2970|nr:flagellar hook capping FlgD N-terminal domain-containing protein [Pusillimonas noertemannii]
MSTVNPLSGAGGASLLSQSGDSTAATQEQFLTLLVTQLQNQDPLNPMDNAEVTSQIAQLSTVNGINQLNNTLLALSGQMDLSQSMQAANLIGKEVLVPGEKISLGSSVVDGVTTQVATPFGVDLISDAAKVTVTILDASGKAVRQMELEDPQSAGVLTLQWDGKDDAGLPVGDGAYTVQVAATDAEGQLVASEALTSGKVSSVAYASTGLQLELGLAGTYSLFDIRKIM